MQAVKSNIYYGIPPFKHLFPKKEEILPPKTEYYDFEPKGEVYILNW